MNVNVVSTPIHDRAEENKRILVIPVLRQLLESYDNELIFVMTVRQHSAFETIRKFLKQCEGK